MAAIGKGSAKLILFGEHAAVFGYPAVGLSLPEQTVVTIHGEPGKGWDLRRVRPEDRPLVRRLMERLEALLPALPARGRGSVEIESTVPRGVGMGSSAALCAAAAGAGLASIDAGASPDATRTWKLAHELERMFHGTPSGIDTGLSLLRGLTAFSPHPPALPDTEALPSAPLLLVIAALPRATDSAELIRAVGDRMRAGVPAVRAAMRELGSLAREARQRLIAQGVERTAGGPAGTAAAIGSLADRAMTGLRGLGVSSQELDFLLEEGRSAGALGGKLSGAGGGGAFFLVAADGETADEVSERISRAAREAGINFASTPRVVKAG
jgi:mevalonate kinase